MNTTNILIVEDELIIAADLQKQLERLSYEVCAIACSTQEARQCIHQYKPDLVLSDIYLQGSETGIVLGKELRTQGSIPFIYITSHYDRATVEEAKMTRPNGYLIKPFSKEDVYVAIEMALMNYAHKNIDSIVEEPPINESILAPHKIKKTVDFIHDNLDKKITLPELAALTGWNMYYFARIFKKYMNESPYQYLLKARIEKAKSLIITSTVNLSQIALELGFENHSHFSQTFRKMVGVSPDAYRKKKHSQLDT